MCGELENKAKSCYIIYNLYYDVVIHSDHKNHLSQVQFFDFCLKLKSRLLNAIINW